MLYNFIDASGEHAASIFRVKEYAKHEEGSKQSHASCRFLVWFALNPEDGGDVFLRNFS
jgi:hypothetical protein